MPQSFISKSIYACNCGPACKCGYSAAFPSNCGCGTPTVKRRVLAEDIDNFYVSATGKAGKAYDVLGEKPFTSPDGKPLQRFPKDRFVVSLADRIDELKGRAQTSLGDLSQKISPNYQAEDVQASHHDHSDNRSIRRTTHRGKEIVIKTDYQITIDGKPFENHVMVDDKGRVHCHGLPNYAYLSMLDLIKGVIDISLELSLEDDIAANDIPANSHQGGHH